jgi:3-dehydroquinate synthase
MARTITLTGFMGAGKSSVGRIVARRLGREFVDLDELIAEREGTPVAEIFSRYGEGFFRDREKQAAIELGTRENLVIATGGGTVADPTNRTALSASFVICLDASADEIGRRLSGTNDRPLLNVNGREGRTKRIEELLAGRQEAYAAIPLHITTDGLTIDEVAERVIALATSGMIDIRVKQGHDEYPVLIGQGLISRAGEICRDVLKPFSRAVIVTNPRVGTLYAVQVVSSLNESGIEASIVKVPDGEAYKTLESASMLYDRFIDARCDRQTPILALGGGVIGDLAGFVAATFLRGVPFVQVPTSLLAMVDASIGGKVAVNHPRGKNLIGAFKSPALVIADMDALETLSEAKYRAGVAEVIKHSIIGDIELFERLESGNLKLGLDDLTRAIRVKVRLVEQDPFEDNVRMVLNLGHTFAHAIEHVSDLQIPHGEAVAMGLVCAGTLARRLGLIEATIASRITDLLARFGLPTRIPAELETEALLEAMQTDKKRTGNQIRLILPRALGQVEIFENVTYKEIVPAISECR